MTAIPSLPAEPRNDAVLQLFRKLAPRPGRGRGDPYRDAGCHPDAVARLWDELGGRLPSRCAFMAAGHPVLAAPASHVIFGFALGTAYALWLPPRERAAAAPLGTIERWSDGSTTDLAALLGDGWTWGHFQRREEEWCKAAYEWLQTSI